jgi:orotate phosphoribosyltransferase
MMKRDFALVQNSLNLKMIGLKGNEMVVCIGEALVDLIDGVAYPGGCPLNTAIAASRLGVQAMLLNRISVDKYGQILA